MSAWDSVWAEAEAFRTQHPYADGQKLPVDVFSLVELDLRLDIIPFDDLSLKYGRDAALMPDFSGIYVDAESYVVWEKGPLWKQNRLRFTVAHELGHFVLHQEESAKIQFHRFADFTGQFRIQDGYRNSMEQEADEFAGRLLVPINRLTEFYDKFAERAGAIIPHWHNSEGMRQKFAEKISSQFGVNIDPILIRLDREGLWPAS